MTSYEVGSGFVLPYILKGILGNGALGALLLILYLAVTSVVSAQLISVSSIVSFDIYKTYIHKEAKNHEMIRVSHFGVVFFGLFAAGFSLMLHYVDVNMSWMGYFITMMICPGVIPLVFTITWKKQTRLAAFIAPITGLIFGIVVWILTCKHYYNDITVANLGEQLPCLWGGLTALFLPGIVTVVLSFTVRPYDYDWEELRKVMIVVEDEVEEVQVEEVQVEAGEKLGEEVQVAKVQVESSGSSKVDEEVEVNYDLTFKLYKKLAYGGFTFMLLLFWVVWPLPLYRDWVWSRAYFKGYLTVGLLWIYLAFIVIGLFPLYDGRHALKAVARGVYRDYVQPRFRK